MEDNNKASVTSDQATDDTKLDDAFMDHHSGPVETPKATRKEHKTAHYNTQNSIPIAEIRNGVVILKDGSFKAVIRAEAINFDLMSGVEQEAVEYAYQAFLNSLYFPIQINIQSRRVDAETYLKKLKTNLLSQNNMLLSVLIEDYLGFIEELIESTDIMNKGFYIVVPFYNNELTKENAARAGKNLWSKLLNFNKGSTPMTIDEKTLDKARKELRYRVAAVIDGLRDCGVVSQPLNTQQLIEMYYEYYNPETTISQPLGSFGELSAPFVSKAGEYHSQEKELRASQEVENIFSEEDSEMASSAPIEATEEIAPEKETQPSSTILEDSAPEPLEQTPPSKGLEKDSSSSSSSQSSDLATNENQSQQGAERS